MVLPGLVFACAVMSGGAMAQAYPAKSIRLIVPLAPGGGNDTIARLIGQKISPSLGQQVVVDNRAGAGGLIGAEMAAKSPPDGYTLLLGNVATMTIIPNSQKKVPYDPLKDFQPVSLIASAPLLVVVHPSLPVSTIKELVSLSRAKPGAINYASNGIGTSTHLATEMFSMMAGVKWVHVPYKGLSLAMTDLLSGQVPLMFSSAVAMLPPTPRDSDRCRWDAESTRYGGVYPSERPGTPRRGGVDPERRKSPICRFSHAARRDRYAPTVPDRPSDPQLILEMRDRVARARPRVLHMWTRRAFSQSDAIDAICGALHDAGLVEYRSVANVPPSEGK